FIRNHAPAKPPLKASQQQCDYRRPENAWLTTMMAPSRNNRCENQETHCHTEQSIEILGPHQRRIEERTVKLRREGRRRCRRNPGSEASRPVRTAQART